MKIRPAGTDDLDFILEQEWRPEIASFITQWTREEHKKMMADPGFEHLIAMMEDGSRVGYAILNGLISINRSIELVRIVVLQSGQGLGLDFLTGIKSIAFDGYNANRLWLDVFPSNERARKAYVKAGFTEEGTLREAYFHDGRFRDLVIMSILEKEYRAAAFSS